MSESNGIPYIRAIPQKPTSGVIDYQVLEADYTEYQGNSVVKVSWGIDNGGTFWQELSNKAIYCTVSYNSTVTIKVKAKNGDMAINNFVVRNIDSTPPEFQPYSDGKLYKETLPEGAVNFKARSVKVEVSANDGEESLGLAEKPYACITDREFCDALKEARRTATKEELQAMVDEIEWQESGEFEIDEKGEYYILTRDAANAVDYLVYEAECIDNDPPEAGVEQEYNEVEGYVSQNRLIISANDGEGAGLAEKPYSWNGGERTEDNTLVIKEAGVITLDVYDLLENRQELKIDTGAMKFDTKGPEIVNVVESPGETHGSYIKNEWIKIEAEDENISMAPEAYSFDGGASWQAQPIKNVTENGKYNIRVRDALMNETQGQEININNIDNEEPVIDSVKTTPQGSKGGFAKSVLITVEAEDRQSGLSSNAFSFDGGATWQSANTFEADRNGAYEICVRDAFHNTLRRTETIEGIDCTVPEIAVTGNPTSTVYKAVTLRVSAADKETGIASIWYQNDLINIPSAIYQSPSTEGSGSATAEAVINVNGDYTFYAYDALGNVAQTRVTVSKISKKKSESSKEDSNDSDGNSSSGSSKTIVLPPSAGSSTTTQLPVSKTTDYATGTSVEASSGKTIVLKGSASSNSEGDSREEEKKASKKDGDFELEFEEAGEEAMEEDLAEAEIAEPVYEGGLISVESSEHESIQNEAAPPKDTTEDAAAEQLLMSADKEKDKKGNGGIIVLICVSTGVIAAGGVTAGILIKKGVLKIPDFFEEKE